MADRSSTANHLGSAKAAIHHSHTALPTPLTRFITHALSTRAGLINRWRRRRRRRRGARVARVRVCVQCCALMSEMIDCCLLLLAVPPDHPLPPPPTHTHTHTKQAAPPCCSAVGCCCCSSSSRPWGLPARIETTRGRRGKMASASAGGVCSHCRRAQSSTRSSSTDRCGGGIAGTGGAATTSSSKGAVGAAASSNRSGRPRRSTFTCWRRFGAWWFVGVCFGIVGCVVGGEGGWMGLVDRWSGQSMLPVAVDCLERIKSTNHKNPETKNKTNMHTYT
jgi:hypothetical protein